MVSQHLTPVHVFRLGLVCRRIEELYQVQLHMLDSWISSSEVITSSRSLVACKHLDQSQVDVHPMLVMTEFTLKLYLDVNDNTNK